MPFTSLQQRKGTASALWCRAIASGVADTSLQLTAADGIALRLRACLGKGKSVRLDAWETLLFRPWDLAIRPVSILLDHIDHTRFRDLPEIETTNDRGLRPQVAASLFVGAPGKHQSARIKPATIASRIKGLLVRDDLAHSAEREGAHILRGSGASHAHSPLGLQWHRSRR